MQKFKHLAESTSLAWMHSIHIRMHECTHILCYKYFAVGLSQAWIRSFTEFGTFSFVCLLEKKLQNKCIWESATHKLLYTQPDIFRMSSSCTVNRMSNDSFSC